jgi:PAS domain S-box-containing protein
VAVLVDPIALEARLRASEPNLDPSAQPGEPLALIPLRKPTRKSSPSIGDPGVQQEALAVGEIGSWSWHTSTHAFSADRVARRLWGLPEEGLLDLQTVKAAIYPEDIRQVQRAALDAIRKGSECHITFRLQAPAGKVRWVRIRARRSEVLGPAVIVGVTIDVTDRKLVETALGETERRLQRAQSLGGAVPFECDYATGEVLAGTALKTLVGLLPDQPLTHESLLGRIHPNDRAKLEDEIELCSSRPGPYESTCRVILPDDTVRWLLWRGESLLGPDGGVASFAGVMIDISGRKEVEDELRASRAEASGREREIQALYRNASVGLALIDREFRYLRANPFLAEIHGIPAEELVGHSIFDVFPDIRVREPSLRQVFITEEPVRDIEVEATLPSYPDGKATFRVQFYPLVGERGAVGSIGIVMEDITALKRAENARALLNREVTHRIKNLFAVISGLIALSAKGDTALTSFARSVRGRIQALAHVHDLVLPAEGERDGTRQPPTFQSLLQMLLAPYTQGSWRSERIIITGADPNIGPGAATAVALALHEFATNAARYGSLSSESGRLLVDCQWTDGGLEITWQERGGPAIASEPQLKGFGSVLARRSLVDDLGGAVSMEWAREGLTLHITLPRNALDR